MKRIVSDAPKQMRDSALASARQTLDRAGNRTGLIMCLLLCILATVSVKLFVEAVADVMRLCLPLTEAGASTLAWISYVVPLILCFFLVSPLYLGVFSVAMDMIRGKTIDYTLVFSRYRTGRTLARSWHICFRVLVGGFPFLVPLLMPTVPLAIPNLLPWVPKILTLATLPFLALGFLRSGNAFPFVMIALDHEDAAVTLCLREARVLVGDFRGRRHVRLMRGRMCWRFLLSLLSIGAVTLLHTLPLTILTYAEFSAALIKERGTAKNAPQAF